MSTVEHALYTASLWNLGRYVLKKKSLGRLLITGLTDRLSRTLSLLWCYHVEFQLLPHTLHQSVRRVAS